MSIHHLTITISCQVVNYSSVKSIKTILISLVKQALKGLPGTIDFTNCSYIDVNKFTIELMITTTITTNIVIAVNSYLSHYVPTEYTKDDVDIRRIRMSASI